MRLEISDSVQEYLCKYVKRCDPDHSGELCVICLEPCSEERKCFITHCGHHYHDLCLLEHFKKHNFCPYDRGVLFSQPTIDKYDIFLDYDLEEFFSYLPDVAHNFRNFDYYIEYLMKEPKVFDDLSILDYVLDVLIPKITRWHGFWLRLIFGSGNESEEKQALSFSDEAIAYYVMAIFIEKIKSRVSLKLWLQLEKMRQHYAQSFYECQADSINESQEEWFLDAALPGHSFVKHIAHVLGRSDMARVTQMEVTVEHAADDRADTLIVLTHPGKVLDLQFGNPTDALKIQLLHAQILKITDSRATGTLSKVDIDVKAEEGKLVLQDPEGNKHTFVFKFD